MCCAVIFVLLSFAGRSQSPAPIFSPGMEGYACFRIPGLLMTPSGDLLAFAEARKYNCRDEGRIDLVVRRSPDKGLSWGPLIMVWSDSANTCGNPVPVVDHKTGAILLLMSWNLATDSIRNLTHGTARDTRRVFVTRSNDDGLHWRPAEEITSQVKQPSWNWYATGPCHGIQLEKGKHKGRIVIPCDYIETGKKGSRSLVIWSDDSGGHWSTGDPVELNDVNECTVAEVSDGSLLLSMRCKPYRRMARSFDGGASWKTVPADTSLIDPSCQGSVLSVETGSGHRIVFSHPHAERRVNMSILLSGDDGRSWPGYYSVYPGPAGYSDLVQLDKDHIGILYERGLVRYNENIVFESVGLERIIP